MSPAAAAASAAAHRIMVVEDEEMIRDSLVEFLDDHGYRAVGAADGREALSKLGAATDDDLPCLILLDLMMPVMDGKSFREHQLQTPGLAGIPVVIFSAYQDLAKTADELRAAGHLPKPLKLTDLLRLVREHCPGDEPPTPGPLP
jgi:CheY-like chemotaxis protein